MARKMTYEEKLYSMTMKMLLDEAEKVGVKIDKKGKKETAVNKILAAVEMVQEPAQEPAEEIKTEKPAEICGALTAPAETVEQKPIKKERKQRQKKVNPDKELFTNKIKELVTGYHNMEFRTWEKLPNIFLIKANNKSIVEVRYKKDGYKMAINPKRVDITMPTETIKYYLNAITATINYTDTVELETIINTFGDNTTNEVA